MAFPLITANINAVADPTAACGDINSPGYFQGGSGWNGYNIGPWLFGGVLYQFGQHHSGSDQTVQPGGLEILKSTDNGTTWFAQDVANSDTVLNNSGANSTVIFDPVNGFIHLFFITTAPRLLKYKRFNCNTNTWGVTVDSGISQIAGGNPGPAVLLSSGAVRIFIIERVSLDAQFIDVTNQVFGVAGTVAASAGYSLFAAVVDGSDKSYLVYSDGSLHVVTIAPNGTIGTPVLIDTNPPSQCTRVVIFNGKLIIPYTTTSNLVVTAALRQRMSFYETVSLVDLTTTSHDLHDGIIAPPTLVASGCRDFYPTVAEVSGTLYFLWDQYVILDPPNITTMYGATYDGVTISAPFVVWDQIVQPYTCAEPGGSGNIQAYNYFFQGISATGDSSTLHMVAYALLNQDFQGGLAYFGTLVTPPLLVICDNPPNGQVGHTYTHTFPASGGTAPYTFSIGGFVPPGLSLNASTGVLSGIPTLAGTFIFSITVTDANSQTSSVTCTITIVGFSLGCGNPPNGSVGVVYTTILVVTGGTSPFAFTLIGGALPDGLSLIGSLGAITGTPTATGTFTFTVHVVDANGLATDVTCSITIGVVCDALRNPQIPGTQEPIDAATELYLRRFVNDMGGSETPSDQN